MGKQLDLEDLANELTQEKSTAYYVRVSAIGQKNDIQIVDKRNTFADRCSGSVLFKKRPEAKKLLKAIEDGKYNQVQVNSIDRLGRDTVDILNTIQMFTSKGINVKSTREGLETIVNGKENPIAKMIVGILGTLAEFELNRTRERTQEGREKAKLRGAFKGRVEGSSESDTVFFSKAKVKTVMMHLKKGESLNRTALLSKASLNLVRKVRDKMEVTDERP